MANEPNSETTLVGILTPRQTMFVSEYIIDFNGKQAAIRAGYSPATAEFQASRLLRFVKVQYAIQEQLQKREGQALLKSTEVERKLDAIIRSNLKDYCCSSNGELKLLHELTEEQVACIKEIVFLKTKVGTHMTIKLYDRLRAIELKMKRLGMLREQIEMNHNVETHEDRIRRLRGDLD